MENTYIFNLILNKAIDAHNAGIVELALRGVGKAVSYYDALHRAIFATPDVLITIIKHMKNHGLSLDIWSDEHNGKTPLHWAARNSNWATEMLINSGARLNIRDMSGKTPLYHAVEHGPWLAIDTLITSINHTGGDMDDQKTTHRDTILHALYLRKDKRDYNQIIRKAVHNGVDINDQNADGYTALHFAVTSGNPELEQLLLGYGADPCIKNRDGKIPFEYACEKTMNHPVKELLVPRGYPEPQSMKLEDNASVCAENGITLEQVQEYCDTNGLVVCKKL